MPESFTLEQVDADQPDVFVGAGWLLPAQMTATFRRNDSTYGDVTVTLVVEPHDGHVRARRICVDTDWRIGLGAPLMRSIEIRHLVRDVVWHELSWVVVDQGDVRTIQRNIPEELLDDATNLVEQLVGYRRRGVARQP